MARAKIMEFPSMARPKIVRTAQEAAAVPPHLPIQVEIVELPIIPPLPLPEALEKLRQAKKQTARAIAMELFLAETKAAQLRLDLFLATAA